MTEELEPATGQDSIHGDDRVEERGAIIQDVIDGESGKFDPETMADYDADFRGSEPLIINIWTKQRGHGFGYLAFHDFLRRVGMQKTFLATDMTADGASLIQKAVNDGLVEKVSEPFGLQRLTRWKVVGDPVAHLEQIRDDKGEKHE